MIANITQGNYTHGLLKYHEDKIDEGQASVFMSNSLVSEDKETIRNIFASYNAESKRKDKNFHVSLNFKKEDYNKLEVKDQESLVKDYMEGIGFPEDHPYIVYLHKDKGHPHFHVVTSKILENGKALNDQFIFRKSQRLSRKLELKYNITEVSSQKNNIDSTAKSIIDLDNYYTSYSGKEIPLNTYITNVVNNVLTAKKPKNIEELNKYLLRHHLTANLTNHKDKGVVFRFNNYSRGVAASKLTNDFTYKNLEKTFKENLKTETKFIAGKIDYIFYKYDKINLPTYKKELAKHNIELLVNETNGVIRGFSYKFNDYKFKGQDLPGRKYTMGKIKHKFMKSNEYNEYAKANAIFNKHKNTFNYDNHLEFIIGALSKKLKPIIIDNTIYLTSFNSKNITIDNKNSIELLQFNQELKSTSSEYIYNLNKIIDEYEREYLDKNLDYSLNKEPEDNLFEDIFETLRDNYYEENDDLPTKKRRRRKKL